MGRFTDRIAVVTGASKGIGGGIAKRLAAECATAVVNYASSREGVDRTVDEIVGAGGKAVAIGAQGALDAITKSLAKELAPRKIRVTGVNPGSVVTEGPRPPVSSEESSRPGRSPTARSGAPADRRTSRLRSPYWPPTTRAGSPASRWSSPAEAGCDR